MEKYPVVVLNFFRIFLEDFKKFPERKKISTYDLLYFILNTWGNLRPPLHHQKLVNQPPLTRVKNNWYDLTQYNKNQIIET